MSLATESIETREELKLPTLDLQSCSLTAFEALSKVETLTQIERERLLHSLGD